MCKRSTLLCCICLACFSQSLFSQKLIALQHNGASTFFTDLPATVAAAMSGDTIYLPGGIFPAFNIDKKLTIIGAGHNPDSTAATTMTVISGNVIMSNSDCDGSVFTGLRVNGSIADNGNDNDNIQISRCFISSGNTIVAGGGSENWTITECFVNYIQNINNSFVNNNLIHISIYIASNCQIENNIFLFDGSTINGPSNYCTVKNNIFKRGDFSGNSCNNSLFYNNIYSFGSIPNGAFGTGNIGVNNINDTNFDGLFTNFSYAAYGGNLNNLYQFDFHLVNSAYNTGGTNGTAIGIYGGIFPWKEGSVPSNPHINLKVIAPATNSSGNLPVQIRVAAQDH